MSRKRYWRIRLIFCSKWVFGYIGCAKQWELVSGSYLDQIMEVMVFRTWIHIYCDGA